MVRAETLVLEVSKLRTQYTAEFDRITARAMAALKEGGIEITPRMHHLCEQFARVSLHTSGRAKELHDATVSLHSAVAFDKDGHSVFVD